MRTPWGDFVQYLGDGYGCNKFQSPGKLLYLFSIELSFPLYPYIYIYTTLACCCCFCCYLHTIVVVVDFELPIFSRRTSTTQFSQYIYFQGKQNFLFFLIFSCVFFLYFLSDAYGVRTWDLCSLFSISDFFFSFLLSLQIQFQFVFHV